jgi:Domain of unknown function (DUF4832)/Beta-galactosidase
MSCALPVVAAAAIIVAAASACSGQAANMAAFRPTPSDEVLVNPGMGWETFHSFEGDPKNANYPHSSIAYFRYYWKELEPKPGEYRWELIDEPMKQAAERGQSFAFRVMPCNGEPKVPQWLRDMGCAGKEFEDGKSWQPDYADPLYLKYQGALVKAMAERYDGNPLIDHVDIGSLGRWGEWHTSGTGMDMPPVEVRKQIVDWYLDGFQKTPLVMLIADADELNYAVSHGTGWRADCLGDLGGFSPTWNHMQFYPEQLQKAKATEAWRTAPVCFEVCWTMSFWHEKGWDPAYIFSEALKMHVSTVNAKSSPVPEPWWPEVEEFSKRMGYRLVLRELQCPAAPRAGQPFPVRMTWENLGVAPCYRKYPLAIQLRSGATEAFRATSSADLTTWLPGSHELSDAFTLPADLKPGKYALRLAFLDPETQKPRLKLAIAGREEDGWYRVGEVEVGGE